ncbi:MAG: MlaD family protein [Candidatus Babeliales bacterium]
MQIKTETVVGLFIIVALSIFFYMTVFLGVFRLHKGQYRQYTIAFDDVSGLEKKADVKIAGVKVGWVERIVLTKAQVYADVMVDKQYPVYEDAQALVRQDSFLGPKYLEIIPGDSSLGELDANHLLPTHGQSSASIDTILRSMEKVTHNVEEITSSLNENLGGTHGRQQMHMLVNNVQTAVERFAALATTVDRTVGNNEENINTIISDFREAVQRVKELLPSIDRSVTTVSNTISNDIDRVSNSFEGAVGTFEQAALQVRDGFKNVNSIAQKLDEGRGVLGKLINEDETYRDIKVTINGLRKYFNKVDALGIVIDSHGEFMYRNAENVNFEDTKGYMDIRIHPNDDHFYVLQYVMAQKGNINRSIRQVRWFDENYNPIFVNETFNQKTRWGFTPELFGNIETRERVLDQAKFGFQVGKVYKDVALRVGIFENSAGLGIDFNIPFGTERMRWVTSLEAFDFRGRDRFDDKRPHFKWLNRLFFMRNLYVAFGADDIISKENANGFFGAGIRFCDDDIKYLVAQFGVGVGL